MAPSSPEFFGKAGPLDSHTRPGPCPQAPWENRGDSLDMSRGEGPTWATAGDSRMVGTIVQTALEGLTIVPSAGTRFPRGRDGGCAGAPDVPKVLRAEATLGRAGEVPEC